MKDGFHNAIVWVLAQEGGFANLKNDEVTNLGVKKSTWADWIGKKNEDVSIDDMRKLTVEKVMPLYRKNYWDAVDGDKLQNGLDLCALDFAVNSGPGRALGALSHLTGISLDRAMRDKLITDANSVPSNKAINDYCNFRVNFLRGCRNFDLYGKGWLARVERLRAHALDLINHPPAQSTKP